MKWEAAARPMILLRKAMGRTSAPYNQVVLFNMPSADQMSAYGTNRTLGRCLNWHTVDHGEEVNPQDSKAFADLVVGILELSLHDRGIDFDNDNASETSQDHPGKLSVAYCGIESVKVTILATSPLICEIPGGNGIGDKRDGPIDACQNKNHPRAHVQSLVEDGCE